MDDQAATVVKGPRPMGLHLANGLSLWREAPAAAARLRTGTPGWHPNLKEAAEGLRTLVSSAQDWDRFTGAVAARASARATKMLSGITAYLNHPYERPASDTSICLELGACKLHDFGGSGTPILMVPSLINPYHVLDLMPRRSLATYLKGAGYRPFLVEWYDPGHEELGFDTGDFIMKRLIPFLKHVTTLAGRPVPVIGYCMGGTLALGLAARAVMDVAKLVLVAAPWNFATSKPPAGRKYARVMSDALARVPAGMPLPIDAVQAFFTSVDPTLSDRKFRQFADMDPSSEAARFFVALERWANTGAPLPRRVAEDTLIGWYQENRTATCRWMVGGAPVDPADVRCPVWIAAPEQDRLVPQACAYAAADGLRDAVCHDPGAGHVGMMVGSRAETGLWHPMLDWLRG
jgi:polyhydroxyalkanoate synthase